MIFPFQPRFYAAGVLTLATLLVLLAASHLRGEGPSAQCLDELMVRSNQFANNYNNHIQTNDVKRTNHEKAHERLDREYAALRALQCW
jgi:hypothetical protein